MGIAYGWMCSLFLIPGIGDDEEKENTEPAKLVDFDAEVRIQRQWKSKVGKGLGEKYIRLQPLVTADRVVGADAYGTVVAFDRFSGKEVWRQQADEAERRSAGFGRFMDRSDGGFVSGGVGGGEGLVLLGTTRGDVIALSQLLTAVFSGEVTLVLKSAPVRQRLKAACLRKPSTAN